MKRITHSILGALLIATILLPAISARASMVPKKPHELGGEMKAAGEMRKVDKGRRPKAPLSPATGPYTGEGAVVGVRTGSLGDELCVAQIQQADNNAFNAYVRKFDYPLIRRQQGEAMCAIFRAARRSGKKVRVEGEKFASGGPYGSLGKMWAEHVSYYKQQVGVESPDVSYYAPGEDFGCIGFCTVRGWIVRVDANVGEWEEWPYGYKEQSTMCRAILHMPDNKIVKLFLGGSGNMEELKKDDPGKLAELGSDPIGLEEAINAASVYGFDDENDCKPYLEKIRDKFNALIGRHMRKKQDVRKVKVHLKDITADEQAYVSGVKRRAKQEFGCSALAEALNSQDLVAVYGYSLSAGKLSYSYMIDYPASEEAEEEAVEEVSDDVEQYVYEGHIEDYGEDDDWAVGPTAF